MMKARFALSLAPTRSSDRTEVRRNARSKGRQRLMTLRYMVRSPNTNMSRKLTRKISAARRMTLSPYALGPEPKTHPTPSQFLNDQTDRNMGTGGSNFPWSFSMTSRDRMTLAQTMYVTPQAKKITAAKSRPLPDARKLATKDNMPSRLITPDRQKQLNIEQFTPNTQF